MNTLIQRHPSNHSGFFGLGQFVLLLSLAPFIFDLHLYGAGQGTERPALYEYDPHRFESLPPIPALVNAPKRPRAPKPLNKHEKDLLRKCHTPTMWFFRSMCQGLHEKNRRYQKQYRNYKKALKKHAKSYEAYLGSIKKRKDADRQYRTFQLDLEGKPALPAVTVKETASTSFTTLLSSSIALDSWRVTGTILWAIGLALIGPAVLFAIKKRSWSLLIIGLSIPAFNYAVIAISYLPGLSGISGFYINSSLIAQIAFLWFAFKGHIRHRSFFIFIAILFASVLVAHALGDTQHSVFKLSIPTVIFVLAALLARFVALILMANLDLLDRKHWKINSKIFVRALALWLPLGAVISGVFYATNIHLPNQAINHLHYQKILIHDSDKDFLDNTLISIATKMDDAIYAWHLTNEQIKLDIYKKNRALQEQKLTQYVIEIFDNIVPQQLDYTPYTSDAVVVVKQSAEIAVNAAQASTNTAYKKLRKRMRDALLISTKLHEQKFDQALQSNTAKALAVVDQMHQNGLNQLISLNTNTQRSLWDTINTFSAFKLFMLLIASFMAFKSFLYVFARLRFNPKHSGTIGFIPEKENITQANITATGLQYPIQEEVKTVFYISRRLQCRGRAPKLAIPQFFSAFINRFRHKALSMNKIVIEPNEPSAQCTATKGIEFFEWQLEENEHVIFDFHNFVGMTSSVSISTQISAHMSSLLFGKLFFPVATGPGKLILMAEGRAEVSQSQNNQGSFPPERIIACNIHSRFYVDSENDFFNVYLSQAYIKAIEDTQMIVDVDSLRGVRPGLWSFVKRFMLPV